MTRKTIIRQTVCLFWVGFLSLLCLPALSVELSSASEIKSCGYPDNSPIGDARLNANRLHLKLDRRSLLVVHAQNYYGTQAKSGLDHVIKTMKARNEPVIYIVERDEPDLWITEDRNPTAICNGQVGQHRFEIDTPELVMAGGLMNACLGEAMRLAHISAFRNGQKSITFHLPMDAITLTQTGRFEALSSLLPSGQEERRKFVSTLVAYNAARWKEKSIRTRAFIDGEDVRIDGQDDLPANAREIRLQYWSTASAFENLSPPFNEQAAR